MILQAILNGARNASFHPDVPVDIERVVESAVSAVQAGADEIQRVSEPFSVVVGLKPQAIRTKRLRR